MKTGLDRQIAEPESADFDGKVVTLSTVAAGQGPSEIVLDVQLPDGYKVNDEASSSLVLGGSSILPGRTAVDLTGASFPVLIPIELTEGRDTMVADLTLIWCREDAQGLCLLERARFEIPMNVSSEGTSATIRLPLTVELPEI